MTDGKILLMGDQASPVNLHQLWPTIPYNVLSQPLHCTLASLKILYPFSCVLYFSDSTDQVVESIRRIRKLWPDVPQIWVSPNISSEASVAAFRAGVQDILFLKEASEVETYLSELLTKDLGVKNGKQAETQEWNNLQLDVKRWLAKDIMASHDFLINDLAPNLLQVRYFGTFCLSYQGEILNLGLNQREKSLLSYLLLRASRPIHKDRLAEVFWPESTASSSKNLLHVTISRIRKWAEKQQLPASFIKFENNCYAISSSLQVETDYGLFRKYYRKALQLGSDYPEQTLPHLLHAANLYKDIILEDIYTEQWVNDIQLQAFDLYLSILHHIGELLHELSWYKLAIKTDELLITHDPLAEQAYHRLMIAYSKVGWRNKVVQCFQKYKNTIAEIQLQPAPEIIASVALLTGVECL